MKNLTLEELYNFREKIKSGDYSIADSEIVEELIMKKEQLLEDVSGMGNASVSGMGNISSSQPSMNPGALNGNPFTSGGGVSGSGDISVPYNAGTGKKLFQNVPAFGRNHGSKIGKKPRNKKLNLKELKNRMSIKQDDTTSDEPRKSKVMNFNDFNKDSINKVIKVKEDVALEGKAFKAMKTPYSPEPWDRDKKEEFRIKLKSIIKSFSSKIKINQIGNDFELINSDSDSLIAQVMFRLDHIGIKKDGDKFTDKFGYDELGKIKKKLSEILKKI